MDADNIRRVSRYVYGNSYLLEVAAAIAEVDGTTTQKGLATSTSIERNLIFLVVNRLEHGGLLARRGIDGGAQPLAVAPSVFWGLAAAHLAELRSREQKLYGLTAGHLGAAGARLRPLARPGLAQSGRQGAHMLPASAGSPGHRKLVLLNRAGSSGTAREPPGFAEICKASDKPSDNAPRHGQTQRDPARHRYPPGLR